MRDVHVSAIVDAVKKLCMSANLELEPDMLRAFDRALTTERSPAGKQVLQILKDNAEMAENSVVQCSVMIGIPFGSTATIYAINEAGTILDTITLAGVGVSASLWGTLIWGSGKWGPATGILEQRRLPWTTLLTFKQAAIAITIPSALGVAIGNLYIKHKIEGYLMQGLADNP